SSHTSTQTRKRSPKTRKTQEQQRGSRTQEQKSQAAVVKAGNIKDSGTSSSIQSNP
ncbi:unnamed protein product, partial [Amoebophrya sp. A25]